MGYRVPTLKDHFDRKRQPKRILALDGGGLRGILTLGVLQHVERLLRKRHRGGDDFRLGHYFDLIAGTSTGAIIAAALAQEWSIERITREYKKLGAQVFERTLFRQGYLRARYDHELLSERLRGLFGPQTRLGGRELKTGLLVVMKRLDSGSPWPVSNNPHGRYYRARSSGAIANADYPLWQVVRASTAAPTFFDPEIIDITQVGGRASQRGLFVDGGVSPFNNPALQAFMYATLGGYRVRWATGADKLLLVSVGTGAQDPTVRRSSVAALHGVDSLRALMEDCSSLQETMLQWMSRSPTARRIDRELGALTGDLLCAEPLLRYCRYDLPLTNEAVGDLVPEVAAKALKDLHAMDAPKNMDLLHRIGIELGSRRVKAAHFPKTFDLPRA